MSMKWSAYNKGNFFTHVKRVIVILANKARILAREIAKQLGSLLQRQRIISDRRIKTTGSDRSSIGFRQLLRRLGIVTSARLSETIRETKEAIKYDVEFNKRAIMESSQQVSTEITINRRNLNEILAQQLREEIGIDCQAPEIGSLQVEHKRYYSYNFPMSPKVTTNRGCIIVKGKRFNIIQVIQRN
ncbi:MAG: hypothetical protein ACJ71H_20355 [Nitrososphaeraceae archaeon]